MTTPQQCSTTLYHKTPVAPSNHHRQVLTTIRKKQTRFEDEHAINDQCENEDSIRFCNPHFTPSTFGRAKTPSAITPFSAIPRSLKNCRMLSLRQNSCHSRRSVLNSNYLSDRKILTVLSKICHHKWFVYRVSPLFQMPSDLDSTFLRHWASLTQTDVQNFLHMENKFAYKHDLRVKVCITNALRGHEDCNMLKIIIHVGNHSNTEAVEQEEKHNSNVEAYLINFEHKEDDILLTSRVDVANLPLLLIRSNEDINQNNSNEMIKINQLLISAFMKYTEITFDCLISPLSIVNQDDMKWALAVWCSFEKKEDINLINRIRTSEHKTDENIIIWFENKLTKRTQSQFGEDIEDDGLIRFKQVLTRDTVIEMWQNLHDIQESCVSLHEITSFYKTLVRWVKEDVENSQNEESNRLGKISSKRMSIVSFDLPSVSLSSQNVEIEIGNSEIVHLTLSFLTEMCAKLVE